MKSRSVASLSVFLLAACASQSALDNVEGDVKKLREESQNIRTQSAGSYSEISQLRDEIASTKGSVEELRYQSRQNQKRFDTEDSLLVRKTIEMEGRIARMEQYLGFSAASPPQKPFTVVAPPPGAPAGKDAPQSEPKPVIPAATPDDLLKEGLVKLSKKDNPGARDNFTSFISQNPQSDKVDDAQFYIAESYFNEKWYEKAVLEYQVVIAKYSKSNKRAAALYKQALSFEKIGDAVNAKARFKDVVSVYPSSPEAALAKKKLQ